MAQFQKNEIVLQIVDENRGNYSQPLLRTDLKGIWNETDFNLGCNGVITWYVIKIYLTKWRNKLFHFINKLNCVGVMKLIQLERICANLGRGMSYIYNGKTF